MSEKSATCRSSAPASGRQLEDRSLRCVVCGQASHCTLQRMAPSPVPHARVRICHVCGAVVTAKERESSLGQDISQHGHKRAKSAAEIKDSRDDRCLDCGQIRGATGDLAEVPGGDQKEAPPAAGLGRRASGGQEFAFDSLDLKLAQRNTGKYDVRTMTEPPHMVPYKKRCAAQCWHSKRRVCVQRGWQQAVYAAGRQDHVFQGDSIRDANLAAGLQPLHCGHPWRACDPEQGV